MRKVEIYACLIELLNSKKKSLLDHASEENSF